MRKADEIRSQAGAVRRLHTDSPSGVHQSKPKKTTIRTTVDLLPVRHRSFSRWCMDAADQLGVRVTRQDVLDVLVHRLLTDETLARKIRDDLTEHHAQKTRDARNS